MRIFALRSCMLSLFWKVSTCLIPEVVDLLPLSLWSKLKTFVLRIVALAFPSLPFSSELRSFVDRKLLTFVLIQSLQYFGNLEVCSSYSFAGISQSFQVFKAYKSLLPVLIHKHFFYSNNVIFSERPLWYPSEVHNSAGRTVS